jgi:hypothetical protein
VAEREYVWTEAGLANAEKRKIELHEVDEALHAPDGLRLELRIGSDLLVIAGMAETGRVIAVRCEQRVAGVATYWIMAVHPVTGANLDEWRRRVR